MELPGAKGVVVLTTTLFMKAPLKQVAETGEKGDSAPHDECARWYCPISDRVF
jgi:hypothetical protein